VILAACVEVGPINAYGDYAPNGPPANGGGPTIFAFSYYPGPGYQAPTGVYPSAACPGYAPIVSSGSDPHIIHLPAARIAGRAELQLTLGVMKR